MAMPMALMERCSVSWFRTLPFDVQTFILKARCTSMRSLLLLPLRLLALLLLLLLLASLLLP
jgi:hypothetical protein